MRNVLSKSTEPEESKRICLSAVWNVEADSSYSVKWRRSTEKKMILIRTVAGSGILHDTEKGEYHLTEDTLLLLPVNRIAGYRCDRETWTFWWFEFEGTVSGLEIGKLYFILPFAAEHGLLKEIFSFLGGENALSRQYASTVFAAVVCRWSAMILGGEAGNGQFGQILRFINGPHQSPVQVSEVAERFHLSERTLRNLFTKQVGVPPKQYIESRQFEAAKELLTTTDLPVREIAGLLGFDDPYYFSRFFKKWQKVSPRAYRMGREKKACR